MGIQLYLPGAKTPEQAERADLEDAFARTTIELCELRAAHGDALECLIEAIDHMDKLGVPRHPNDDRWRKVVLVE